MAKNALTGIERKLVIDYLIQNDVPLTLSEVADSSENAVPFPVAFRGEETKVLEQGIIILQNAPNASQFDGKIVKIQFYFNKLALYFETKAQASSAGIALVIPETIFKVEEKQKKAKTGFSVTIFYETSSQKGQKTDIECDFDERFPLFTQADSESCIERFLREKLPEEAESIDGRFHAPKVIFADSRNIVFAAKKSDMCLSLGSEYALMLCFPIAGPIKERKVYLSCVVEHMFESYECDRLCALANFSSIREEDERFLCDKMKCGEL